MKRLVLTVVALALGCGPPPAPDAAAPPPPPPPPLPTPCELACDHALACEVFTLGDRDRCLHRCGRNDVRDREVFHCLDSVERCDRVRACTTPHVETVTRPTAEVVEGRVDLRALGPSIEIALEGRLVSATTEVSRYDAVLVVRGASPDGGLRPLRWLRLGGYASDGRLPLIRITPSPGSPLTLEGGVGSSRDRYEVVVERDALRVEHAFRQGSASAGESLASRPRVLVRAQLARDAIVQAVREIDP